MGSTPTPAISICKIHNNLIKELIVILYQGYFWIIGESKKEIRKGNFHLLGQKLPCDENGKSYRGQLLNHCQLFSKFSNKLNNQLDYYPRGKVIIYSGRAFILISDSIKCPAVLDRIKELYNLYSLNKFAEETDVDYDGMKKFQ